MKALITGFDAFGGAAANPSGEIAARLGRVPCPAPLTSIESLVLPTVYADAAERLRSALARSRPDLVLMFGLAARASEYRLERFAVNVADCADPDNAGCILDGQPVVAGGPAAYRTGLDVASIANQLADGSGRLGWHRPAVSNHAGTFVCNFAYFTVLHEIATSGAGAHAVFVHVPWSLPPLQPGDLTRSALDRHVEISTALLKAIAASLRPGASAA